MSIKEFDLPVGKGSEREQEEVEKSRCLFFAQSCLWHQYFGVTTKTATRSVVNHIYIHFMVGYTDGIIEPYTDNASFLLPRSAHSFIIDIGSSPFKFDCIGVR